MAYIGREPLNGLLTKQIISHDSSTTTFALDFGISSTTSIIVSVNAVILQPDVGYTLSGGGTSIVFASAPSATTYIHYLGQSIVTNLLDVNGVEFILDADADTSLTADTDDEIDIKIGGTDRSTIKSTGFHNIDSYKFVAGTGDDMQVYHDGTNSYITNATGALKLATESSGIAITIGHSTSEVTIADNMTVAGDLTVTGTTSFADTNITNVGSIALDTITNDGTDITLDSSGDIILDAGGDTIFLKDSGTTFGSLDNSSSNLIIKSGTTTAATFSGANVTLAGTLGVGAITGTSTVQGTTITATTAFVPDAQDGAALGTTSLQFSDLFLADSAVLGFGDDNDTTLTHTDGTGLTLNSTNKLCFNDASQFIQGASNAILDIAATDEIELTATLIDVVGNFTNSGTIVSAGVVTAAGFTIGSAVIGEAELEILDGATVTTTELNLIDGNTSRGTTAVASGDGILINDAGTMAMTNVDTVSTYFASHSVGGGNIVTTGALGSGSIAAGFGAIDNGTSGIRTNTFTAETSIVPDASGGADIGTNALEWGDFYIADDKYIQFGSDQNILVGYDETTTDSLKIAATEGAGLAITLMADEGDDAGDEWKLNVADGGTITLGNDIASAGTFVTHLTLTPHATITSSLANFAGEVQMVTLDIGGTNVTSTAAELNILDDVTATTAELNYSDLATLGTSAASKVITADANNLTKISGGIYLVEDTLSFDATQDWDVRASPVAKVTLTANVTFDAPTNPTTGQYISVLCIQDGTGSRTIAWNAVFEFAADTAPTATTTANLGDLFTFRYNGAKWLEVGRNLALTLS
jgi:hypothetical protein